MSLGVGDGDITRRRADEPVPDVDAPIEDRRCDFRVARETPQSSSTDVGADWIEFRAMQAFPEDLHVDLMMVTWIGMLRGSSRDPVSGMEVPR